MKIEPNSISQDIKHKVIAKGKSYEAILHTDAEGGGYWVECAVLPGCSSQGDTEEDALVMIQGAIKGHLAIEAKKRKKAAA